MFERASFWFQVVIFMLYKIDTFERAKPARSKWQVPKCQFLSKEICTLELTTWNVLVLHVRTCQFWTNLGGTVYKISHVGIPSGVVYWHSISSHPWLGGGAMAP